MRWGFRSPTFMTKASRLPGLTGQPVRRTFYLFDREGRLVYRGQMDDSRPGNGRPVTGADLRAALDAVLDGRPVSDDQKPSIGCNIKWKPGNEPDYFPH